MSLVKSALGALGKSDCKITAVFATNRAAAERAVRYLRNALDLPIFLFTPEEPDERTAALCERVVVGKSSLRAHWELWPYWIALSAVDWTGSRGKWALKLSPFFIPPFRMLILNENWDYFPASFPTISNHASRRFRERRNSAWNRLGDLLRGVGLLGFASIAQFYSPLSRYAFRKLKQEAPLHVVAAPPAGEGISRFAYQDREWDRAALMALLTGTSARWILFERSETAGQGIDADRAIAFADENTFAVSLQIGVREWRKLLFATAPFRALQPDEATRVLAPVSTRMLIDRHKLLALGVPDLSSFGANWLLLFWKAAAAGWDSYNVGGAPTPGRLAAVPYDEAEFVKTVLEQPALWRLNPCESALSRGNVARSNGRRPAYRGYPRVLILSPYLPYPLSHGGAVRIYNLCRALTGSFDFVLACFREHGEKVEYAKLHEIFREVFVVDVDEKHVSDQLPKQVCGYESSSMRALVAKLCREKEIAVLQVEYTQMAAYREAAPQTPAILVEHDLTFTLYAQLADRDPALRDEHGKWLAFERDRLRAFTQVWTMSAADRERAIMEGSAPADTVVIPNGVDLRRFSCGAAQGTGREILYVGSFRHLPNFLGFNELRREIMPEVWRQFPDAQLRVVAGPDHLKHWPGPKHLDARITVQGFTENLLPLYREAQVVVVPLPVSAGTNIKVMEALACGRAVVTTPLGCAGLGLVDGKDAMIRDLGASFAEAICLLLGESGVRESIAATGHRTAVERFSWDSIAEQACESYSSVAKLAASPYV